MSGTVVVRPASGAVNLLPDAQPDNDQVMRDRGIEFPERLMIEEAPALRVPEEIRAVIVPEPSRTWAVVMAGTGRPYPFAPEILPSWEAFIGEIRRNVTDSVNAELRDAVGTLNGIEQRNEVRARVLQEANSYLSEQVFTLGRRMEEILVAQQSPGASGIASAIAAFQTPLAAVPRWERTLQQSIRDKQYTLRAAPQPHGRSRSLAGKPETQIRSSKERAKQARKAKKTKDTSDRAAQWAQGQTNFPRVTVSSGSDEEYQDSNTGETPTPTQRTEGGADRSIARSGSEDIFAPPLTYPADAGTRDRPSLPTPAPPIQQSAGDEITQAIDSARPPTAVRDPPTAILLRSSFEEALEQYKAAKVVDARKKAEAAKKKKDKPRKDYTVPDGQASRSTMAGAQGGRSERTRPFPHEACESCGSYRHSTLHCPRCQLCTQLGHDATQCTECRICGGTCRDICPECQGRNIHLASCRLEEIRLGMLLDEVVERTQRRQTEGQQSGRPVDTPAGARGPGRGEGRGHVAEPVQTQAPLGSPHPDPIPGNRGPFGGDFGGRGRYGSAPPPPPSYGGSDSSSDGSSPSSSSSSSSSDSDADDEGRGGRKLREIRKLKKKLKALKRKGRGQLPHRLDVRPFDGKPDDFKRFSMDLESSFDQHRKALRRDMDKIRLVVPLLEGEAKKWYESVHHFINKHAARRAGVPFDKNSAYRRWDTFFQLLRTTFGGSLTRDKSVLE